jgi:hypothetical protein
MACPFFEPREPAALPRRSGVRLPLIDEYTGVCHASGAVVLPAEAMLSTACNQGYAYACPCHPSASNPSAMRYSVVLRTQQELTITWIEEQAYSPVGQGTVRVDIQSGRTVPAPLAEVISAQITAFCRSYLKRCVQQKDSIQEQS